MIKSNTSMVSKPNAKQVATKSITTPAPAAVAIRARPKKTAIKRVTKQALKKRDTKAPIYDSLGYELSPRKIKRATAPRRISHDSDGYMEMLRKDSEEGDRKCEIMGTAREQVSAMTLMAWQDRVARELGIAYHKVEMRHFEELREKGFVGKEGEFEAKNMSEPEIERITKLAIGSAFRK